MQGFTLLELVIAIAIFALMSAMAYGGLNSALNTRAHADRQAERLAQLQKALLIIGRDLEQAIGRPVRDNYGSPLDAFSGGGYGSQVLEFSRAGRANPLEQRRSQLQRVAYRLADERLLRQAWPVLDRAIDSQPHEAVLLDGVGQVELRFMDGAREWQPQWPPAGSAGPGPMPAQMPRAVELSVELAGWGRLRRVYEVSGS